MTGLCGFVKLFFQVTISRIVLRAVVKETQALCVSCVPVNVLAHGGRFTTVRIAAGAADARLVAQFHIVVLVMFHWICSLASIFKLCARRMMRLCSRGVNDSNGIQRWSCWFLYSFRAVMK
jgi:hypothetical protein